jgi:hypothetical protein
MIGKTIRDACEVLVAGMKYVLATFIFVSIILADLALLIVIINQVKKLIE